MVKLRLSRNKKTGKSKHYAFIQFETPEIAQIVADTMNNYLLFGHRLLCKVMTDVHEDIWKGANKKFHVIPWKKKNREQHNRVNGNYQALFYKY